MLRIPKSLQCICQDSWAVIPCGSKACKLLTHVKDNPDALEFLIWPLAKGGDICFQRVCCWNVLATAHTWNASRLFFCCLLTAKVQSHTGQEDDSLANQKVTGTITIADDNGWRWWHVQAWRQSCLHYYLPDGQWMPKKTKLHRLNEPVLFNPLYKRTCQGNWEIVFDLAKNDCLLQVVWDVLLSLVWGQWLWRCNLSGDMWLAVQAGLCVHEWLRFQSL